MQKLVITTLSILMVYTLPGCSDDLSDTESDSIINGTDSTADTSLDTIINSTDSDNIYTSTDTLDFDSTSDSTDVKIGDGGYIESFPWKGYAWTGVAANTGSSISPDNFESLSAGDPLCVEGVAGATEKYSGLGMLGINIGQEKDGVDPPNVPVELTGEGVMVNITNTEGSDLRVQIQNGTMRWCAKVTKDGEVEIPWSSFNTKCWDNSGDYYDGKTLIEAIMILVPGDNLVDIDFNFCLNAIAPYGDTLPPDSITLKGSGILSGTEAVDSVMRNDDYYAVQSNVWGANANQTISYLGNTFEVISQDGDNSALGAPVSYPSSFIGSSYGRDPQEDNLPIAVKNIASVETSWTWDDTGVTGSYNASYDVWFSDTSAGDYGGPSGGFLMVWLYDPPLKRPSSLSGLEFSVILFWRYQIKS
ncbi:MAG: hypothetical protein JXR91_00850 [Deltaproteobacteria bacterium]|nr:hypothetical protein [Deltaproteobacteria bacterium]